MPIGSVQNAVPLTVLPGSLMRAFRRSNEWYGQQNEYRNGERQRATPVTNSRKSWRLAKRLTSSQLATLRTFFFARRGGTEPFYFYDGTETSPMWTQDDTGVATTGRYTVRFEGEWSEQISLPRHDVELELIELA